MTRFRMTFAILAIGTSLVTMADFAFAFDDDTVNRILGHLSTKPRTVYMFVVKPTPRELEAYAAEDRFVDSLRNRKAHSLSPDEREKIATIALARRSTSLDIAFKPHSVEISSSSLANVQALGEALSVPYMKGSTLVIVGHTDATGRKPITRISPNAAPTRSSATSSATTGLRRPT